MTPTEPGEKLLADWRPDRARYWRDNALLGVVAAVGATLVLWLMDVPAPLVGALGAAGAVAVRAAYLASETLGQGWQLTERRVLMPGGRAVGLAEIETARNLMGAVQLITRAGDKHLLRHLADPAAALAELERARSRRARRG